MKSVASNANYTCPMFVCSIILIILLLQPLPAKAQDFTYPEGTMAELLQQVNLFARNAENALQGYFIWIVLVPGSYHTERLLMAPEYQEEVASYSITNAGLNEFCVMLNVSRPETAPTQDCLQYSTIASIAFVDDFLGLRVGELSSIDNVSSLYDKWCKWRVKERIEMRKGHDHERREEDTGDRAAAHAGCRNDTAGIGKSQEHQ